MSTSTQITAEELARMPKDQFLYELVRGELRRMSPAGFEHGEIELSIGSHLRRHVKRHGLGSVLPGDTGFRIASDPDTVRSPDVAYVSNERLKLIINPQGFVPLAPDLAIEILSPSDTRIKMAEKAADWLESGTLAVVVIDPRDRTVAIHRTTALPVELTEADLLTLPDVVPGWAMPVSEIFE